MTETKQQQIERLTAALEWYADPANHEARKEGDTHVWPIYDDRGKRARQALGIPERPTVEERLAAIERGETA